MKSYSNIDEYLENFSEDVRDRMKKIRSAIKKALPEVGEKISYGVPTMTINGKYFLYFAGFAKHISIYPVTPAIEKSVKDLDKYRTGKGTLQFPNDKPLPMDFIEKIIGARLKECHEAGI